jgi:hypothetical protein
MAYNAADLTVKAPMDEQPKSRILEPFQSIKPVSLLDRRKKECSQYNDTSEGNSNFSSHLRKLLLRYCFGRD